MPFRRVRHRATLPHPGDGLPIEMVPTHSKIIRMRSLTLEQKAQGQAGENESVVRENKVQGVDSNRRPELGAPAPHGSALTSVRHAPTRLYFLEATINRSRDWGPSARAHSDTQ
jgi:hypothetical protein